MRLKAKSAHSTAHTFSIYAFLVVVMLLPRFQRWTLLMIVMPPSKGCCCWFNGRPIADAHRAGERMVPALRSTHVLKYHQHFKAGSRHSRMDHNISMTAFFCSSVLLLRAQASQCSDPFLSFFYIRLINLSIESPVVSVSSFINLLLLELIENYM